MKKKRLFPKPVSAAVYRKTVADMCAREQAKIVVEVGVYAGGLSKLLVEVPSITSLTLVDPWIIPFLRFDQNHMDQIAKEVQDWACKYSTVKVFRMRSVEAAKLFDDNSIDFWHTDGDHQTEMVKLDINSWFPKVKSGCLLTGDNYEAPHVAAGVDSIFPHRQLSAKGRVWWVRK